MNQATRSRARLAQIKIPLAERLGQIVVEVEGLTKGYGDRVLIKDLTFKLPPGGIVGVIGANGAGKTTLFRMITGQEKPDQGTITVGETVQLGYVDQTRDDLDGKKNVWEEISGGHELMMVGKREVNSRAYCSRSTSRAPTSRRRSACCQAGSATACIWPRCSSPAATC